MFIIWCERVILDDETDVIPFQNGRYRDKEILCQYPTDTGTEYWY